MVADKTAGDLMDRSYTAMALISTACVAIEEAEEIPDRTTANNIIANARRTLTAALALIEANHDVMEKMGSR